MAMSPRLLRPIASRVHPEANAWRTAVVAAGGSVSALTMKAVSKFCGDIDAAGIRDRFVRLNLFCGNSDASLIAVRVPLYRGPSATGTTYSDSIDTNNNFVEGDYAETGASGGLLGNGSTKKLEFAAVTAGVVTAANAHASVYGINLGDSPAGNAFPLGNRVAGNTRCILFTKENSAARNRGLIGDESMPADGSPQAFAGQLMFSAVSSTDLRFYSSGVQTAIVTTDRGSLSLLSGGPVAVFAAFTNGLYQGFSSGRIRSYSFGIGMTDTQSLAYYNALQAFQTALGRAA